MSAVQFDRDAMAHWYAEQHLKTDPGIRAAYFLPNNAPAKEIRLVEINELVVDRSDESLEPVDFGVDTGMESEHKLFVLDVTPTQWDRISNSTLALPLGWSLDGAVSFPQIVK